MPPSDEDAQPERIQTDASLDAERRKTDDELTKRREHIEEDADHVVTRARDRADAVMRESRRQADRKTEGVDVSVREAQREQRAQEDEVIVSERDEADRELLQERSERERALKELLRFERESTDSHLLVERARADAAIFSRDDFLGIVSHDLRTLLGGIALQSGMLAREATSDDSGRKILKRASSIQRFTARMNRLVGDLLDVVSIDAGRLSVTPASEDARRLIRDTMEAFEPAAATNGITLSSEVARDRLFAAFDYDRVLQVLANLVSNALKFTPRDGRILLSAEPAGDFVQISVEDTGAGIPVTLKDSLFDRFTQAAGTNRSGLGLGLYISKCIIEAQGGRIWLEQTSAAGSKFCFTLSKAQPTATT